MKMIQVRVPLELLEGLQQLVDAKIYPHRAEAIRLAVKDLLDRHRRT